ncbi:MAG: hypothetical protein RRA94_08605 [Bacteroidota bacterium]|nr:hypothetical protein [Bacteroidota bacterium]
MNNFLLSLSTLLVFVTITSCCPCERARTPSVASYPGTKISFETGGGFSGYVSGTAITADGLVLTWNGRPGMRENLDTLARMDAAQHAQLLADLYALEPAGIRHQESGNMTTSLTVTSGDESWYWSWPGVRDDIEAVPEKLRPLRDLVVTALDAIRPAQE